MTNPLYAMDQSSPDAAVQSVGLTTAHKIPQVGARPLVFNGSELAMAMSFSPELPYWYEINLYRTDAQEFVVAIRLFFQSEDEVDRCKSWAFPSLDEALDQVQHYDAGSDVPVPEIDFDALSAADMAAMALNMKAKIEAQRNHFKGLAGELFMEIEAADAAAS